MPYEQSDTAADAIPNSTGHNRSPDAITLAATDAAADAISNTEWLSVKV